MTGCHWVKLKFLDVFTFGDKWSKQWPLKTYCDHLKVHSTVSLSLTVMVWLSLWKQFHHFLLMVDCWVSYSCEIPTLWVSGRPTKPSIWYLTTWECDYLTPCSFKDEGFVTTEPSLATSTDEKQSMSFTLPNNHLVHKYIAAQWTD